MADSDAELFFASTQRLRPPNLEQQRQRMDDFVKTARSAQRRVALVTSGGTTVPLEMNTVRFIDNFSTGSRGANCSEELINANYAVIFLYRNGSNFPFLTKTVRMMQERPLDFISTGGQRITAPDNLTASLLPIGFTTIFDYLFLLREACQSLQSVGADALVCLAAAVSDFYVPEHKMATEKLQSRAHDGLILQLQNVPKLLGTVKTWAPLALLISFKLETNPNILLAKAAAAMEKYGVDLVCANLLHNYRDLVTLVRRDPNMQHIEVSKAEIEGEEAEAVAVSGISTVQINRGDHEIVDKPLVQAWLLLHQEMAGQQQRAAMSGI